MINAKMTHCQASAAIGTAIGLIYSIGAAFEAP